MAFLVLPLIYNFTTAFKPLDEMIKYPPPIFVKKPTLQNFVDMVMVYANTEVPLLRYVFNSVWTTGVAMFLTIYFQYFAVIHLQSLRLNRRT